MIFNRGSKPKWQRPDPECTFEGDFENPREVVCPRCGQKGGLSYIDTKYLPGEEYKVYECFNYGRRTRENPDGLCGQRLYCHFMDPSILWVSPNGKWTIHVSYQWGNGTTPWFYLLQYGMGVNHRELLAEDYAPWDDCADYYPKYVREAMLDILRDYGYTKAERI